MDEKLKNIGEIISTSGKLAIAQCYKEEIKSLKPVSSGDFVKVGSSLNSDISFGIVTSVNNSSLDQIHKPSALGLSANDISEIQLQLYELLRKEFEIYFFAYSKKNKIVFNIPNKPMLVHDFVYFVSDEELMQLTENLLPVLEVIKTNNLSTELASGVIKTGYEIRNNDYNYLLKSARKLPSLLLDKPDTLMMMLAKMASQL